MKEQYQNWIDKNYSTYKLSYGHCKEAVEQMNLKFPELTKVRGYYYCAIWGKRAHWWLKDKENNVIDPTVIQFPSRENGEYIEWKEGTKEPTGICINCGVYCYNGDYFCSDKCANLVIAEL